MNFGSRVTLRFILKRLRRISPTSATVFKKYLFQAEAETRCFDALVAYSQARSAEERTAFGAALLNLHKQQMSFKIIDAPIAGRNIYGPLVLTLMTFKDFRKNAKTLSYLLRVDFKIIEDVLNDFQKEQIVIKNDQGDYEFAADILKVPDNPDLRKFYEYWIERAKKALDLPVDTRKYRALNFALTGEEYKKALEKLDEYAIGLLNQFNNVNLENRTLYMFETTLFPITQKLESLS